MNEASHLKLLEAQAQNQAPGLIWAFHAPSPTGPAQLLPAGDISSALAAKEGWVWLHFDLVDKRAHDWIGETCALPIASRSILEGHDLGLTLGHDDGVVYGISPELHQELERRSNTIGRLHFAVSEHLLVTGRRHPLTSVGEIHESLVAGTFRPATAFDLFETLVNTFGRNVSSRLAEASEQLDRVEDHLVTERLSDERRNLKQVRRLAVSLHRPISTLAALFQDEEHSGWELSSHAHEVLHRLAARLERLDREVVMINDRARLLQEELSAELADESNRSLRALAVMSALLLPGTLVVGIFGMNTAGLPLSETSSGFAIAIILGLIATGLFYWLLKRAGLNLRL